MTLTVEAPAWGRVRTGFRAQAVAHLPHGRSVYLGGAEAKSPRLAMRWLRQRAAHVADQLDPSYARPLQAWLDDDAEQERALQGLARGELYGVQANDDTGVSYDLTVWPAVPYMTPRPLRAEGTTPWPSA